MKYKLLLFNLLSVLLLVACNGSKSTDKASFDPRDTVQVPEGLTGEDSIAYIENAIFKSPITAEQLLSLQETHDMEELYNYYPVHKEEKNYSEDEYPEVTYRDKCAFRFANKFMRMYHLANINGKALDKLELAKAVNAIIDTFHAQVTEVPRDSVLNEIVRLADKYSSLTQYEMNMQSYFEAAVESYQTYEAYRQWISDVPAKLKELAEVEFVAWHDFNEVRFEFWRDVTYNQEWYSMKPMEIEFYYAVLTMNRRAELAVERDIILRNKPYRQLGKTVTTRQWEAWIAERSVPMDADYLQETDEEGEYMPSEATIQRCVKNLRDTFQKWLAARQAIAAMLPEGQGKSYDNLTADMHARIIETLPSIVPIPD